MKNIIILSSIIALSFSSCKNLVPYTDALQKKHGWTNEQLERAQFYVSGKICLERELTKEFPDQIAGKIVVKNGVKTEVVYLQKNLRVAFVGLTHSGDYIIQCEPTGGSTLTFGVNPDNGGKFVLLASEWKDGYGQVHYRGIEYFVPVEESSTHLLIDLRNKIEEHNNFHKAKGVIVR